MFLRTENQGIKVAEVWFTNQTDDFYRQELK